MEENRLSIESVPFFLRTVVGDSIDIVSVNAEKRGLRIESRIAQELPSALNGDPARLRQILVNLLSNSVKFSSNGDILVHVSLRYIEMRANAEFAVVEFSVTVTYPGYTVDNIQDHGIGIPEDVQQRIFSPFFQADSSVNRKYGGSGLGLNISKRLAELMGGMMWFTSKVGEGSTFSFTICAPVTDLATLAEIAGRRRSIVPPTKRMSQDYTINILVAEDNTMNQQVISRILKSLGYTRFKIVGNGQEAVDATKEEYFHIILMDCMMPVISGFEATEMIRKEIPLERQPRIVALTADAFKENAQKCMDCGMDKVLTKPINKKELSEVLQGLSCR